MGDLLPFLRREPMPGGQERTCFRCLFAIVGPQQTWCGKHDEVIESEIFAARECDDYFPERT